MRSAELQECSSIPSAAETRRTTIFSVGISLACEIRARTRLCAAQFERTPFAAFQQPAAIFHSSNGFFWTDAGLEYPALWAVVALVFVIRGGGNLSVDRAWGREV